MIRKINKLRDYHNIINRAILIINPDEFVTGSG